MKVKELIKLLEKQDPEKLVLIQQCGGEFDYEFAKSVSEKELIDFDNLEIKDGIINAVVINLD
jgi:hypothetical protein